MPNENTDRALAMIAADLHFRAGDEAAVEALYELIVEIVDAPANTDDLYDTLCALVQLAGSAFTRVADEQGVEPTAHFQAVALSIAGG